MSRKKTEKTKDESEDVNTEHQNDRSDDSIGHLTPLKEIMEAVLAWNSQLAMHPDTHELLKARDRLEKAANWIRLEIEK